MGMQQDVEQLSVPGTRRRGRVPRPQLLPPSPQRPAWEGTYSGLLLALDSLLLTFAAAVALRVRFGDGAPGSLQVGSTGRDLPYGLLAAAFVPLWVLLLASSRGYEARFLGTGSEEFKRVVNGSVRFTAIVGTSAFLFQADLSRAFVAIVLPLGTVLLLLGRYAARKALHALRRQGMALHRCVIVGTADEAEALAARIHLSAFAGMQVIGVCLPDFESGPVVVNGEELPVLGPAHLVAGLLTGVGADTVAVAGSGALSSRQLRELSWQIEGQGIDLALAPGLTDVAGPRVHVRPVAGLPLLHVEEPSFGGGRRLVKAGLDLSVAAVLLTLLSPLLLVVALLIKREDRGPVFYRQERVGRAGQVFRIWKFRSMHVDADQRLGELQAANESEGPLFKMREDPRLTAIGARIRRFSLDELPQLFNVVTGSMSLVGPRPPLQTEVDQYADHVRRRLLVKPGMTGLWQVSGRSDLDWEEAVRLDLYYVENWSVSYDLMILWKTFFAVVRGHGAY